MVARRASEWLTALQRTESPRIVSSQFLGERKTSDVVEAVLF
jgi:hypothetical protein